MRGSNVLGLKTASSGFFWMDLKVKWTDHKLLKLCINRQWWILFSKRELKTSRKRNGKRLENVGKLENIWFCENGLIKEHVFYIKNRTTIYGNSHEREYWHFNKYSLWFPCHVHFKCKSLSTKVASELNDRNFCFPSFSS